MTISITAQTPEVFDISVKNLKGRLMASERGWLLRINEEEMSFVVGPRADWQEALARTLRHMEKDRRNG